MPAGLDGHADPVVSAERSTVIRRLAEMVQAPVVVVIDRRHHPHRSCPRR